MPLPLIPLGYVAAAAATTTFLGWLKGRSKRRKEEKEQKERTKRIEDNIKNIQQNIQNQQIKNENAAKLLNEYDSKPISTKNKFDSQKSNNKFTFMDLKN